MLRGQQSLQTTHTNIKVCLLVYLVSYYHASWCIYLLRQNIIR